MTGRVEGKVAFITGAARGIMLPVDAGSTQK
ncbi:hypothetical protein BH10ACT5_BH10ACT5_15980 [soil metagenome]|jgi:hypothetical protein